MNINSPAVVAYARKNGCSDLEALRDLKRSTPCRALSTLFAFNPDMIVQTRVQRVKR